MDPEFAREFGRGLTQILKENVLAPLQGRIAAIETRIARLEAAQDADAANPTLRVVAD